MFCYFFPVTFLVSHFLHLVIGYPEKQRHPAQSNLIFKYRAPAIWNDFQSGWEKKNQYLIRVARTDCCTECTYLSWQYRIITHTVLKVDMGEIITSLYNSLKHAYTKCWAYCTQKHSHTQLVLTFNSCFTDFNSMWQWWTNLKQPDAGCKVNPEGIRWTAVLSENSQSHTRGLLKRPGSSGVRQP